MKIINGLISIAIISFSALTFADDTQQQSYFNVGWYFGAGTVSFDSEIAKSQYVDDSATSIRIASEFNFSSLILGFGFSAFFYKDNAEFSQLITDQYGHSSTGESSANAYNVFGELGYRIMLFDNINFDVLGGYENTYTSERSISDCPNCATQVINLSSGLYLLPRFQYKNNSNWTFALSFQQNLTGDVRNIIALSIGKST